VRRTDKRMLAIIHAARSRARRFKRGNPRGQYDLDDHLPDLSKRFATGRCELTGLPFDLTVRKARRWNSPSIDRIDAARGYTHDNVRFVVWALNAALSDWGERVFHLIATAWLYKRAEADQ
jgi:hypothetical protein